MGDTARRGEMTSGGSGLEGREAPITGLPETTSLLFVVLPVTASGARRACRRLILPAAQLRKARGRNRPLWHLHDTKE